MKNKIAQLQLWVSNIDRRYIQLALFALALVLKVQTPTDGGGGPF